MKNQNFYARLILFLAFFAADVLCAQFIQADGKTYVKQADGSLVEVEIKKPAPEDGELIRPARAGKFGTPHRGAWLKKADAGIDVKTNSGAKAKPDASFQTEIQEFDGSSGESDDSESQSTSLQAAAIYTALKSGRCFLRVEFFGRSKNSSGEGLYIAREVPVRQDGDFGARAKALVLNLADGKKYPIGLEFSVGNFRLKNLDGIFAATFKIRASFGEPMVRFAKDGSIGENCVSYYTADTDMRLLSSQKFVSEISNPIAGGKFRVSLVLAKGAE